MMKKMIMVRSPTDLLTTSRHILMNWYQARIMNGNPRKIKKWLARVLTLKFTSWLSSNIWTAKEPINPFRPNTNKKKRYSW